MASPSQTQDQPQTHSKPCTLCHTPRQILVRCQIDESGRWNFVCPGTCWRDVSGGVEDAKGLKAQYPFYRYGGMWKNKHEDGPVSARKPRKVKKRQKAQAEAERKAATGEGEVEAEGSQESDEDGPGSARKPRRTRKQQKTKAERRATGDDGVGESADEGEEETESDGEEDADEEEEAGRAELSGGKESVREIG